MSDDMWKIFGSLKNDGNLRPISYIIENLLDSHAEILDFSHNFLTDLTPFTYIRRSSCKLLILNNNRFDNNWAALLQILKRMPYNGYINVVGNGITSLGHIGEIIALMRSDFVLFQKLIWLKKEWVTTLHYPNGFIRAIFEEQDERIFDEEDFDEEDFDEEDSEPFSEPELEKMWKQIVAAHQTFYDQYGEYC